MAYNSKSVGNNLSYSVTDRTLIAKWNSLKDILLSKHIVNEISISPVAAEKYKFDLYGLIRAELGIQENQIYPHMIVNGYTSSYDYNGELLRFKIISSDVLVKYYRMFTK